MYKHFDFYISSGFMSIKDEQEERFYSEITRLFMNKGWENTTDIFVEMKKGKSTLQIFPNRVYGDIDVDLKKEVEKILKSGKTFKYNRYYEYGEVFDWTDEEYAKYLDEHIEAMQRDLLKLFKTKRKKRYIYSDFTTGPMSNVCDKYKRSRLDNDVFDEEREDRKYVGNLFKVLVSEGKIIACKTKYGICYRTAKNSEKRIIDDFTKWCADNDVNICYTSLSQYVYNALDLSVKADSEKLNILYNFLQAIEFLYGNQVESRNYKTKNLTLFQIGTRLRKEGYMKQKELSEKRVREILSNAFDWISEVQRGSELYRILKSSLGMTNEEIATEGFELEEYYEDEEDLEM